MATPTFDTTVFYESQGEALARAFVLAAPRESVDREELATWRIDGRVVGPTCRYSSTLQARIPLAHRGLMPWGDRLAIAAEAAIPDPCYWSTELPFLYRAIGEIVIDSTTRVPIDQTFGMRTLSIVRKKIALNGKLWVPRGVRREVVVGNAPLELWRETDTVMVVDDPDEELCREASEIGVLIIARSSQNEPASLNVCQRLGRHPSVVIISLNANGFAESGMHRIAPNSLFAQTFDVFRDLIVVARDSQLGLFEFQKHEQDACTSLADSDPKPAVFLRGTGKRSLVEARAACDRLQADLAGKCDAAGFIV